MNLEHIPILADALKSLLQQQTKVSSILRATTAQALGSVVTPVWLENEGPSLTRTLDALEG